MTFPFVTPTTAGLILVLQMLLAFMTSAARGQANTWVGDGGNNALLRAARRHANLAENGGIFIAGLMLLELSKVAPTLLMGLSIAFVVVRLAHAFGLSQVNTNNPFRLIGGIGTYLTGFVLGGTLAWIGVTGAIANHLFG